MNIFELRFRLDGTEYDLYIDSSNGDYKRILINGKELVNERYTLALNPGRDIIYYPIDLEGAELVIAIDDHEFSHEYNVYLDGVSILDQSHLDTPYLKAKRKIAKGFKTFCAGNWQDILKNNLITILFSLAVVALINKYSSLKFAVVVLLLILFFPLILFMLVFVEYRHYKSIVKNFQRCFRPKKLYPVKDQD